MANAIREIKEKTKNKNENVSLRIERVKPNDTRRTPRSRHVLVRYFYLALFGATYCQMRIVVQSAKSGSTIERDFELALKVIGFCIRRHIVITFARVH